MKRIAIFFCLCFLGIVSPSCVKKHLYINLSNLNNLADVKAKGDTLTKQIEQCIYDGKLHKIVARKANTVRYYGAGTALLGGLSPLVTNWVTEDNTKKNIANTFSVGLIVVGSAQALTKDKENIANFIADCSEIVTSWHKSTKDINAYHLVLDGLNLMRKKYTDLIVFQYND